MYGHYTVAMIDLQQAVHDIEIKDMHMSQLIRIYIQDTGTRTIEKIPSANYPRKLYSSIISQQLTTKAAATIWKRFEDAAGGELYHQKILSMQDDSLRQLGLSRQKARYIKAIAEYIANGQLQLNRLDELDETAIVDTLTKVPGIGSWTAEMFLCFAMAHPDTFSIGDLGLRNAIERQYGIKRDDLIAIRRQSELWAPHRTAASLALWHSLDNKIS